jgi:tetratricopeptide (TPR) repeat protein
MASEKDLPEKTRALWLKALSAVELRNYGYAISLIQAVLKESPGFVEARRMLRRAEVAATKGKKGFLSGLSTASLKGAGMVKKDPLAAMELAEKNLETDPFNTQANHLLKDAANAAGFPEVAAFALETLVEGNPKDTKLMHELGEHYSAMGAADKAVNIYTRITEVNPADLIALKKSKDASARATMKSGGWETAKEYRDLIKDKEKAISLEQKGRVVRSVEMIDQQIGEVTAEWEKNQEGVDLSRRLAKLWEDRFETQGDVESLNGAIYFYDHTSSLVSGSDPGVARKLSDLQMKLTELNIKGYESWLAEHGETEQAAEVRQQLDDEKKRRDEMLISEARRRVERNPTDLQVRYELGDRLVQAGQFTEAIPELQRARQNPNARLKAMNMLGQCYTEKGMLDLAVKQYKDAASEILAMDGLKKEIVYKLGLVFERMGKKDEALACMKEIYDVDYGYMDVARRVESSYGDGSAAA